MTVLISGIYIRAASYIQYPTRYQIDTVRRVRYVIKDSSYLQACYLGLICRTCIFLVLRILFFTVSQPCLILFVPRRTHTSDVSSSSSSSLPASFDYPDSLAITNTHHPSDVQIRSTVIRAIRLLFVLSWSSYSRVSPGLSRYR